jgi:hypothetical protein
MKTNPPNSLLALLLFFAARKMSSSKQQQGNTKESQQSIKDGLTFPHVVLLLWEEKVEAIFCRRRNRQRGGGAQGEGPRENRAYRYRFL